MIPFPDAHEQIVYETTNLPVVAVHKSVDDTNAGITPREKCGLANGNGYSFDIEMVSLLDRVI